MKISYMKTKLIVIITTFIFTISAKSQNLGDIIFGENIKNEYIGQYKDGTGGRMLRNGMGILRLKNGAIYAGDFSEGEISGKGLIISPNASITNAKNATYYVGGFVKGKKERKGVLYGSNGKVLYQGSFKTDKPIGTYPQQDSSISKRFNCINEDDLFYWGETNGSQQDGYGLVISPEGWTWIGTFKQGHMDGLCITIYDTEAWEVGEWKNNVYHHISDSKEQYKRRAQHFVDQPHEINYGNEIYNSICEIAGVLTNLGNQLYPSSLSNDIVFSQEEIAQTNHENNLHSHYYYEETTCLYCKGSIKCSWCDGSGQDIKTILGTDIHRKCRVCHGKRTCTNCKGTGIHKIKRWSEEPITSPASHSDRPANLKIVGNCRDCYGTGKCHKCDGKGVYTHIGKTYICDRCSDSLYGKGKCNRCKGTGQITD